VRELRSRPQENCHESDEYVNVDDIVRSTEVVSATNNENVQQNLTSSSPLKLKEQSTIRILAVNIGQPKGPFLEISLCSAARACASKPSILANLAVFFARFLWDSELSSSI
jgi:hypothetical protein